MKTIPKYLNPWSSLTVRSDNTNVQKPLIIQTRKLADLAAERAVKAREERRLNPKYDEEKDKKLTRYAVAKSNQEAPTNLAGVAADAIDGAMIGASFIPGIGLLTGTTYWGLKGAKDLSQGNYLEGVLETLPFTAPVVGKGLQYAGKAANTGLLFLNSPLTGRWTLLGNKEYRLSPNMAFSGGAGLESRPLWLRETLPGMLIKSLLENGPLEKQLSKQGTISTRLLQAYIGRSDVSGIDKELINKVLLNHQGETHLDYNVLRKEVLEMIPKFNRVPLIGYLNYGMNRLGFRDEDIRGNMFLSDGTTLGDTTPNTFTFESPGIIGNTEHYTGAPLGHSRTYTTDQEPNILHVMESLSDWALKGMSGLPSKSALKKSILNAEQDLVSGNYGFRTKEDLERHIQGMRDLLKKYELEPILLRMADNYTTRLLQENLKYAAENGLTKMRYPTSESAAKIEGYKEFVMDNPKDIKIRLDYDNNMEKYIDLKSIEFIEKRFANDMEVLDVLGLIKKLSELYNGSHNIPDNIVEILKKHKGFQKFSETLQSDEFMNFGENLRDSYKKMYPVPLISLIRSYLPLHQTILKKYADFPKQYEKLFGKGAVRTVTDNKGNTWFEVDVPLRFRDGTAEMVFKNGGSLIPKRRIRK